MKWVYREREKRATRTLNSGFVQLNLTASSPPNPTLPSKRLSVLPLLPELPELSEYDNSGRPSSYPSDEELLPPAERGARRTVEAVLAENHRRDWKRGSRGLFVPPIYG